MKKICFKFSFFILIYLVLSASISYAARNQYDSKKSNIKNWLGVYQLTIIEPSLNEGISKIRQYTIKLDNSKSCLFIIATGAYKEIPCTVSVLKNKHLVVTTVNLKPLAEIKKVKQHYYMKGEDISHHYELVDYMK